MWASGKHVVGIFLMTDIHFAITVISDHHYDDHHHHHHRLNNDNGGDNNRQWQLELKMHLCLEPQVCFSFFANMLTYAQGVAKHNAGNWLQAHMWRLRRQPFWASQVGFLFSSTPFYSTDNYLHTDYMYGMEQVVMCQASLAWKPGLGLGLWGLRPIIYLGQAIEEGLGLAQGFQWPGPWLVAKNK